MENMIADTYKFNSVEVARYIVARANKERYGINITKIQKLLYIAYGAYLVLRENSEEGRLTNEHPQAWPYGPVFPTTRNKLLNADFDSITLDLEDMKKLNKDKILEPLITFVFEGFAKYTAGQLTAWSHKSNSAWDRTTKMPHFEWGDQIPDQYILDYFSTIIK